MINEATCRPWLMPLDAVCIGSTLIATSTSAWSHPEYPAADRFMNKAIFDGIIHIPLIPLRVAARMGL